jgi:PST family polysaccharide transporter
MKYTTLINIIVRSLFVIAVFVIIKSQSDYLYVPLLNTIGAMIAGIISVYIAFKQEHIRFFLLPVGKIYQHFKESLPLFISIITSQIYVNLNKLIIGAFLGMNEITIYDLGEKILLALRMQILMIEQAVFPRITREKKITFINKVLFIVLGIVIIEYTCVYLGSKWIAIFFMGIDSREVIDIINILGFSAILLAFRSSMAVCRLLCFGYNEVYMQTFLWGFLFFLCVICILFLFNMVNLYTLALLAVGVELFICCLLLYNNSKLHLLYTKKKI